MDIALTARAERDLGSLGRATHKRIYEKLQFFAKQANPLLFAKRLIGIDLYRFRIGDYRILFKTENGMIKIVAIKKRDVAYREIGLD